MGGVRGRLIESGYFGVEGGSSGRGQACDLLWGWHELPAISSGSASHLRGQTSGSFLGTDWLLRRPKGGTYEGSPDLSKAPKAWGAAARLQGSLKPEASVRGARVGAPPTGSEVRPTGRDPGHT